MIVNTVIKALLTALTGAISALLIAFRKQVVEFIKFLKKKKKKELLKDVNKEMNTLDHKIEGYEAANLEQDKLYYQKLSDLEQKIMNILLPMREAILSSHYSSLLDRSKRYVQQGHLTADELDELEDNYEIYKKLGGNGHMALWMHKVRELKVI